MRKSISTGLAALLAACSQESNDTGNSVLATVEHYADDLTDKATGEGWSVGSDVDQMTDVRFNQATLLVTGARFDVEVTAKCPSTGKATYEFTTFDKDGKGAAMRQNFVAVGMMNLGSARIDGGEQFTIGSLVRYGNRIMEDGEAAVRLISGKKLVVRLSFPSGQETFEYQQTAGDFERAMAACMPSTEPEIQPEDDQVATDPASGPAETENAPTPPEPLQGEVDSNSRSPSEPPIYSNGANGG